MTIHTKHSTVNLQTRCPSKPAFRQYAGRNLNGSNGRLIAALAIALSLACDSATHVAPTTSPSIAIHPTVTTLQEGDTAQLLVDAIDNTGTITTGTGYSWTSDNSDIVAMSATGVALAIRSGSVRITAYLPGTELSSTVKLTVVPAPSAPRVTILSAYPSDTINVGVSLHFTATVQNAKAASLPTGPLVWSSSDVSVATISQSGDLTALQSGSVRITAQWGNGITSQLYTIVPSGAINIVGGVRALNINDTATLQLVATPVHGAVTPVPLASWSSDNASIISVSQAGQVTAIDAGEATITASSGTISATIKLVSVGKIMPLGLFALIRTVGTASHLEIITETGATLLSVTPSPLLLQSYNGMYVGEPARASLSPDGQSLAYDCSYGVCTFNTRTGVASRFNLPNDRQPSWNRSGQVLVLRNFNSYVDLLNIRDSSTSNRRAMTYVRNPMLAPNGRDVLYECDYTNPYDDLSDICRLDVYAHASLYKRDATALSFSPVDSTMAYMRTVGTQRLLVIEPYRTTAVPDAPVVAGITGLDNVSETAWSPDGKRLALIRMGELWIVDMPGATNPVHIAGTTGSFISSISWR